MAHGTPDYGVTAGAVTRHQLLDVGELAARLGSPVTHDRRGDVIWWDDFECGLTKWKVSASGGATAPALTTTRARNGRASVLLGTAAGVLDVATIEHYHTISSPQRFGFEYSFSREGGTPRIYWFVDYYTGTTRIIYGLRYNGSTGDLEYRNAAGAYVQALDDAGPLNDVTLFHAGKLVVDPSSGRYERFIWDEREVDLSAFAANTSASSQNAHRRLSAFVETVAGVATQLYVDDVILTENEPANP